jgi:sugar (pentulose or hexulose) kinase
MNILALDVGADGVQAAVLEVSGGRCVGPSARVPFSLDTPKPEAAEIPAARLWQTVAAAARHAVQNAGVSGQGTQDVQAIGLSTVMPALVLVDQADQPLVPIWMPADRRARAVARQVWGAAGPDFLSVTGNHPLPGAISALNYRHLVNDDPYLTHDIRWYLHLNGWLGLHLTGERYFDPSNACGTGLFGAMTDHQWSQRWCDYFEVDKHWLPPVVSGATTVGTLRPGPASELNVPGGIPVKLGASNISSALLAADLKPGDLLHMDGPSQLLATITDQPRPGPQRLIHLLGVGPSFVQVTHNPLGGDALEWLRQLCFREVSAADFFGPLLQQALARSTRVTLDPPYLAGDPMEIDARRAAFRDLVLSTDRLDLLAALAQTMLQRHQDALKNPGLTGQVQRVILTGGVPHILKNLLPDYRTVQVESMEDLSLRGIVRLFQASLAV